MIEDMLRRLVADNGREHGTLRINESKGGWTVHLRLGGVHASIEAETRSYAVELAFMLAVRVSHR